MRKLIAGFACSLDGYIEGPKGEYDWILVNKEIDFAEQMKQYDTFLYGRRTYEAVAKMGNKHSKSADHYVFSNSLDRVAEGFMLVKGDLKDEVLTIKQREGKAIAAFGGAGLLTSLLNQNLVDELSVSIIPILLGAGKPMVNFLDKRISLNLIKAHTYSNGTVNLTYQVSSGG
jgi:dihydrofolate reductase